MGCNICACDQLQSLAKIRKEMRGGKRTELGSKQYIVLVVMYVCTSTQPINEVRPELTKQRNPKRKNFAAPS